ncbi:alpha-galactosidase [Chryseolinea sp. T2]|uniref:alpha-galactosidase n=1 Tax=Chryseolinea sp. T2 TaxID=3129255 RepID=UPI003077FB48
MNEHPDRFLTGKSCHPSAHSVIVKFTLLLFGLLCNGNFSINAQLRPVDDHGNSSRMASSDWLLTPVKERAEVYSSSDGKQLVLFNGLIRRAFALQPGIACVDFRNMSSGQQLLRAIKPEAYVTLDGHQYTIGGLKGQPENAYLRPEWIDVMKPAGTDFVFRGYTISLLAPRIKWKSTTWTGNKEMPTGKTLTFRFEGAAENVKGISIDVQYELYDGLPLLVKSLVIKSTAKKPVMIDKIVNEVLAVVEEESAVEGNEMNMKKQHGIYVETNVAYNNSMRYDLSDQTTHWLPDTSYTSQVNYALRSPAMLQVYPEHAPGVLLRQGEALTSVRTAELLIDTYDRERRGLMIRRMYRVLAPWTTQNPIFMHLVSKNDDEVRTAIDQCADTGYEALILSFGSHCNMEDTTASNVRRWRQLADYAHSKRIQIGSYALFSSRRISDEDDVIDPTTGKPGGAYFGNAPCFGSKWGLGFRDKIKYFIANTTFDIWENDGPYAGDLCASTTHPGHRDVNDSRWRQLALQKELYRWCNEHGVYINAPDWYHLDGTHKSGLGYREVNFSLPRDQQLILNRQNIFDGTWEKTPSMSWGFVPLTKYQGGGPEAVLEPLEQHLDAYKQLMMQYYGAGIQACYRGPRLYDTEKTRVVVSDVVTWYKKYRDVLNADLIHLRRADGRDWDGWLHVSPQGKERGMLFLFNPLQQPITRHIVVPLYYTGLKDKAKLQVGEGTPQIYSLNRSYEIELDVTLQPGTTWWATVTPL